MKKKNKNTYIYIIYILVPINKKSKINDIKPAAVRKYCNNNKKRKKVQKCLMRINLIYKILSLKLR